MASSDEHSADHAVAERFKGTAVPMGALVGSMVWVVPEEHGFSLIGRGVQSNQGTGNVRYDDIACVSPMHLTLAIVGSHSVRFVTKDGSSFFLAAKESNLAGLITDAQAEGVAVHELEKMSSFSRAYGRGTRLDLERHGACLADTSSSVDGQTCESGDTGSPSP